MDEYTKEETSRFYIPASTSLAERRPRTLKHDDVFAMFDNHGDIITFGGAPDGLYYEDTRFLSHFELRLDGHRPLLLSSTVQDDNAVLTADLTNPDFYDGDRLVLPRDTIHLHRMKFVWKAACYERVVIRNYDDRPRRISLSVLFDADFHDLFEVRGQKRSRHGTKSTDRPSNGAITIRYTGLDQIERRTTICFDPTPIRIDNSSAVFEFSLAPREQSVLFIQILCSGDLDQSWCAQNFFLGLRDARRALHAASARAASIESSNSIFNEIVRRSVSDLYMLISDTKQGPYPYAGIPWYSTAFGRDGIITALLTLWLDPEIAKGVLKFLAATQATELDPERDAEPGKILHETRNGEMARLGEVPFGLYYGSIDSTPLFVLLAGEYIKRTGDIETLNALWPNIEAALGWIDTYGDSDGDGFVEYSRRTEKGLVNQGWKDSYDSIFHADGSMAVGPIALCEVQAYVYGAKHLAAAMAQMLGKATTAATLEAQAQELRDRFEEAFWCEDLSSYALALDGEKQPCRVLASNAGHTLFTGMAGADRAKRTAEALLGADAFSGWGVRTVAGSQRRYNPMSYHNGSVWPHDNALIALGLMRYGLKGQTARIFKGMFDAATYMDLRRLPELFCGFARKQRKGPTAYPVACSPQAWATVTPLALLQASLGLGFDYRAGELYFDRPWLPDFLDRLHLRNLRMGDSSADVLIHRHATGDIAINVLRRDGDMRIIVVH